MDSPLLIVGLLTWLAALYELRSVIKHPSVMVTSYWFVLVFIAVAMTVRSHGVSAPVDELVGLPHVSRLVADSCGVLALLAAQIAVYTSLASHRRLRLSAIAFTGASLMMMTLLFVLASPLEPDREAWHDYSADHMAAYRLAFLASLGLSFSILTSIWGRYAFLGHGSRSRLAFGLIAAGGVVGLVYVLNDLGIVFRALTINPLEMWGHQGLAEPLLAGAILLVVSGATIPLWLSIAASLHKHGAFLQLRPLWRTLVRACPDVTLLPQRPLWRDLFDVRDADFRLRRQVTEIRDARLLLRDLASVEAQSTAAKVAADLAMDDPSQRAFTEAVLLWTAIYPQGRTVTFGDARSTAGSPLVWHAHGDANDLRAEVIHLTRVARHIRGSQPLRQAVGTMAADRNLREGEQDARKQPSTHGR